MLGKTSDKTSTSTSSRGMKLTLDRTTLKNAPTTTSTSLTSQKSPIVSKLVVEDLYDKDLIKVQLTLANDSYYFDTNMRIGNEELGLRLDILQPEVWVMGDQNFYDCNSIDSWYSSEIGVYGSSLPSLVTDDPQYEASVCANEGLYTAVSSDMPTPTKSNIYNNQPYKIPYLNGINVSGVFSTENVSFLLRDSKEITIKDFSFINAEEANVFVGGLGLAGNPTGSGFLDSLVENDIILSPGYSLWFNNHSDSNDASGELVFGMVDKSYYTGDFFQFDIPAHESSNYPYDDGVAIDKLVLPILPLADVQVENQDNHRSISLTEELEFPVLLDSRSVFSYLPLYMIVNLAIQTNASYSSQVNRWVVECDQITSLNATLNFKFGDLDIKIPLDHFLMSASFNNRNLTFASRKPACFLSFLPSTSSGYTSLGLPFLRSIYLAVDNEGGKIAIANSNVLLNIKEASPDEDTIEEFSTSLGGSNSDIGNKTIHGSIAYIESGKIPFATKYNVTQNLTLTYVPLNYTKYGDPSIPAILSGIIIKSGDVFVTQTNGISETAATTNSKKSFGNRLEPPAMLDNNLSRNLMSIGGGVFASIICIIML